MPGSGKLAIEAKRPSVSCTKMTGIIARTGHNLHSYKEQIPKQISGSNKFLIRGREDETDARAVKSDPFGEAHRMRSVQRKVPTRPTRGTGPMEREDERETKPTRNVEGRSKIKDLQINLRWRWNVFACRSYT